MKTVQMRSVERVSATHLRPTPPPVNDSDSFAAQLATFAVAMRKDAGPLLDSLVEELVPTAQRHAKALAAGTSADRQAALAKKFGLRRDAQQRLRDTVEQAGPLLRAEIHRLAPSWMRSWISDLVGDTANSSTVAPMVTALAERLIKEATK